MNKHQDKLDYFFENYPEENECILFTDGQIFTKKNETYAKQFANQTGLDYQTVLRDETELKSVDENSLEDLTKKELVELAKTKGVELDMKDKKDVLIEQIEAISKSSEDESSEEEGSEEEGSEDEGSEEEGSEEEGSEDEGSEEEGSEEEDYKPVKEK